MSNVEQQRKTPTKKGKAAAKKKKKNKVVVVAIEIVVLIILAVVLFAWLKLSKIEKDATFSRDNITVNPDIPSESVEIMQGYTNIAIFGLDAGDAVDKDGQVIGKLDVSKNGNTDVIMIASINNDTKEVRLVSVYRDTYLDIGDGKYRKCNAAYANGGPEQAINMLNANLDLDISDYVTINFLSVVDMVDAVGGVEVDVTEEEATYMIGYINQVAGLTGKEGNQLPGAGTYTLDGVQACAYARVRYTAGSDYKRTERQRLILSKVIEKAQSSNLSTVNNIIDSLFPEVKTSFSNAELLSLAAKIFDYKMGDMSGFPFSKNTITLSSKGDIVAPCTLESNVIELHEFLFDDVDYEPSATVKANSQSIQSETGFGETDGY
jgi:LCP family protein required for cell wall assembly